MKSGPTRWAGAAAALLAVAAGLYGLEHRRAASAAAWVVPVSTPPGITLKARPNARRSRVAAEDELVLADASGKSLYAHAGAATPGAAYCSGACLARWPPALAPPAATPDGDWSLIDLADGTRQWAYRGAPLHRLAADEATGDNNGEDADGSGWQVATYRPEAGMLRPDGVGVREIADAGGVALVDTSGLTLYVFNGSTSVPGPACGTAGDCAQRWQPLEAPAIATGSGDFAAVARSDGVTQWSYRGRALYRFDGDRRSGDVRGVGVDARVQVALIARHYLPPEAMIHRNAALGYVLATTGGATLYQRDRATLGEGHNFRTDHGPPALGRQLGTASCDEACTRDWPPFTAPADALPRGFWDVARRPNGVRQWIYKGFALYTYAADRSGEINGNLIYNLARIEEFRTIEASSTSASAQARATAVRGAAAGENPSLPADPDATAYGVGVGALFWHAVVP